MSSREQQVLARLIADERTMPQPERDWSQVESGIVARLGRVDPSPRKRSRERLYTAVGLAAAAAVGLIAASLMDPSRSASPHARPAAPITESARKTDPASSGQEPGSTSSGHVEHAGRAHWTLEPGSSARVRRDGTSLVVELESGSIDAEVEPGRDPETFVVQAGDVRVTVHGTQFRVERRGETVDVSVWEGVVLVGSKDDPAGAKLAAPGGKRFVEGRLSSGAESAHARPLPAHGRPRSALPGEPSISDVEAGVSRIQAAAQTCFARHTSAKDGVQVSVRSSVALSMRPDGSIVVQGFEPPLHPSVEGCTRAAISAVRIAASQRGIELSRTLDLKR